MSETINMFKTGIIDPSDLQKYLENRNGVARPVFVYKHRLHDIISLRQDKDGEWFMLAVNEQRMSRMFRIESDLHYDGNFFYMNDSKDE